MKTREEKNKKIQDEIIREERNKKARKIFKITGTIGAIILLILCYGIFIGAKYITVSEHKITSSKLPESFHGTKIVQISDLLYNSVNENDLKNLKKKINELNPDIIVFTGNLIRKDYVLTKEDIKILEKFFLELEAKIKKYAVIGEFDDDSFYVIMENGNFKVLSNQEEIIYNKDTTPIKIIGIDTNKISLNSQEDDYYSICILNNPDKISDITKEVVKFEFLLQKKEYLIIINIIKVLKR